MAEQDRDWEWEDERPRRRRRARKGPLRRLVSVVKLAVFLLPLGLFLYGSVFADCRARASLSDWTSLLGATACARSEMLGNAFSMQDNFATLKRLID
jgi:hypothetical protein